jgi:flagellar biosynthetic protein FlhB
LRYDAKKMAAPTVVAKGKGLVAEQIVRRARELKIPIVQNIPLARALIHVELGAQIPVNLYQAVAEVLAFVYRLRRGTGGPN